MASSVSTSAISPYIARVKKAIDFFEANEDKTSRAGLMVCIAGGPGDESHGGAGEGIQCGTADQQCARGCFANFLSGAGEQQPDAVPGAGKIQSGIAEAAVFGVATTPREIR